MTDLLSKETESRPRLSGTTNIHGIQFKDLPITNERVTIVNEGGSAIFVIHDVDARQLSVTLTPENENDNLRINQVLYPSGRQDGPFGRTHVIPTTEKGRYQITVAPNTMASGKFPEAFTITIQ